MDLLKIATVWLGGCSGCHMSFLDMDEFLVDLAGKVEIVYSPVIDVKEYPKCVDVCLVEGAVCNRDNLELLLKVRRRTRVLISFGDCAVTGNVSAIRNQLGLDNARNVLQCAYIDNAQGNRRLPREEGIVPDLLDRVRPLHELVAVEAYLPGCPPSAQKIRAALERILAGLPPQLAGEELKFG
jgi:NAD-reducing hydrogenase small subunit